MRTTEIVAFSPGTYEALSVVTSTDAGVVDPTRIETAFDVSTQVDVDVGAAEQVPNVSEAVPAATA